MRKNPNGKLKEEHAVGAEREEQMTTARTRQQEDDKHTGIWTGKNKNRRKQGGKI